MTKHLSKKISFGVLKSMRYYTFAAINIAFIPLLKIIGYINSKNDYTAIVDLSYLKLGSAIFSLLPSFFMGSLMARVGSLNSINLQITGVVMINLALIFLKGFWPLAIMIVFQGLFLNYDICMNSMINWTTKSDFTNTVKTNEIVLHLVLAVSPFFSTICMKINESRAWEYFFLTQAISFLLALAFFKFCFRKYSEKDFMTRSLEPTDQNQNQSPPKELNDLEIDGNNKDKPNIKENYSFNIESESNLPNNLIEKKKEGLSDINFSIENPESIKTVEELEIKMQREKLMNLDDEELLNPINRVICLLLK